MELQSGCNIWTPSTPVPTEDLDVLTSVPPETPTDDDNSPDDHHSMLTSVAIPPEAEHRMVIMTWTYELVVICSPRPQSARNTASECVKRTTARERMTSLTIR